MTERVLVVDDEPINRKLLTRILGKAGYAHLTASAGAEALAAAEREGPDLILLDVMMPGMDGFEVCARLKSDPATADIPVIFLSALGEPSDKVRGLGAGAADYVTKPFDGSEVLARVSTQLRLRALNRSLVHANQELLEKQRVLEEDLRAAADIQRALIPKAGAGVPGIAVAWIFEPCLSIGGDVFNVVPLDQEHVALYVLDVNGHGVPPAMVAVSVSQSLSPGAGIVTRRPGAGATPQVSSPAEVLHALDREYPLDRFDRFFTISYLVLSVASGTARYSSAGHPPPVLLEGSRAPRLLEEGGPIIGLGDSAFECGETRLSPGDRLFLYTDGILELEGPRGRFGRERFLDVLRAHRREGIEESCRAVHEALRAFAEGSPPGDDVSLLAVEYLGGG